LPLCRFGKGCDVPAEVEGKPCILHDPDPAKDQERFTEALREKPDKANYRGVVFPICFDQSLLSSSAGEVSHQLIFDGAVFLKGLSLAGTIFREEVRFRRAHFCDGTVELRSAQFEKGTDWHKARVLVDLNCQDVQFKSFTDFNKAKFRGATTFARAIFDGHAMFDRCTIAKPINFSLARFPVEVSFLDAVFERDADATFIGCTFGFANLTGTVFKGPVNFGTTIWNGPVRFAAAPATPLFGVESGFVEASFNSSQPMRFVGVDLRRCYWQGANVKSVEFVGVMWPRVRGRIAVADEAMGREVPAHELEALYRELKQNYEQRRDYATGGDFHVAEKDMRLANPRTPWHMRALLRLYRAVSLYGEDYRRAGAWTLGLWVAVSIAALWMGLEMRRVEMWFPVSWETRTWGWAFLHGLRAIFRLSDGDHFRSVAPAGESLVAIAGILGPLFLGLFALALRQRLKR
jgi:uncharacterized protein YjbI with pentapeptide repeats